MTERQIHTQKEVFSFLKDLVFPRVGGESRGEQILFSAVSFLSAFLFAGAEAPFGTCPFGLALLTAVRNRAFLVFAGAVTGICFRGGNTAPVYIVFFTLTLLARFLLSLPRNNHKILPASPASYHEAPALRVSVGCLSGLSLAIYQLAVGGFRLPSLLYGLGMILFTPVLTFLYLVFLECDFTLSEMLGQQKTETADRLSRFGRFAPYLLIFSAWALGATLVYSLKDFYLFGFSFAYLGAAFLTLYASNRKDALTGGVFGLLATIPLGYTISPAFGLLGFFSGILWKFGSFYALLAGCLSAGVYLSVTGGVMVLLSVIPEILLSAALFWPIFAGMQKREKDRKAAGDTLVYYNQNTDLLHMKRLSEAFLNLSGTFRNMAEYMKKPDRSETLSLCRQVAVSHCKICEKKDICSHTGNPPLSPSLDALAERLSAGKRDLLGVFSETEVRECTQLGAILTDVLSRHAEERQEKDKNGAGELLSADYAMLSRILSDAAENDRCERAEDKRLASELCAALESHGGFHGSVTVFGQRQKQILLSGNYWEGRRLSVEEIRALFEQLCCCRLSDPAFDFSGGQMTVEMHTERRFDCEFTTATLPGSGEMSGDVIRSFENAEQFSYKLLSDGMGSGKTASMTAELTGAYL